MAFDHRRAEGADERRALQIEPRRVEHQRRDPVGVLGCPQGGDQAAGGVTHQHDLVMVGRDQVDGGVEFQRVVVEIGDEAPQVPAAQAAAVPAKIDRIEVVADVAQVVGQVGLEEVVVPAVQIEHGRPGAGVGRLANERGDQLDVVRLTRRREHPGQLEIVGSRSRPGSPGSRSSHRQALQTTSPEPTTYLMNRMLTGYL